MGTHSICHWLRCVALVAVSASVLGLELIAGIEANATQAERIVASAVPTHREADQEAEVVGTADALEVLSSRVVDLETTTDSAVDRIDDLHAELAQLREQSEQERRSLVVELEQLHLVVSRLGSESESAANALRARLEAGLGEVRGEGEAARQALDDRVRAATRDVEVLRTEGAAVSSSLAAAEVQILEEEDQRRSGDRRNATQVGIAAGLLLIGVGVAWWSGRGRVASLDSRIQRIQPEMADRIEQAREQIAAGVRQEEGNLLHQHLEALEQITATLESIQSLSVAQTPDAERHDLPLGVCNELNRIENNLLAMESTVRGHKQLNACARRVKENLQVHGYEITELRGRRYDGGMLVEAEFVSDDGLASGDRIISRITRPEVRFGGTILQNASVKVSVGP